MGRTDRASRVIAAAPATVYGALLDRKSLEAWLQPEGMRGQAERWDPRPGHGFRMVLTYLDPADSPGKTSDATDVVDVRFVDLVPGRGDGDRHGRAAGHRPGGSRGRHRLLAGQPGVVRRNGCLTRSAETAA
jgi:hypothetical protein